MENINPILPFRAVVSGSAYPQTFTPQDAFAPDSDAAKAALDLGCLSGEDVFTVRAALGLDNGQTGAAAEKAAAEKADAEKADAEKAAAEKADAEKADAEKADAEKAAAEKKAQRAAPENKSR